MVGEFAGEEVVERGSEAPDVGGGLNILEVHDLLSGHEDRCSSIVSGDAHAGEAGFLEVFGEAEVGDFGDVLVDEDVLGFDVAVDEALLVGGGEAFERLDGPWAEGLPWQGAAVAARGIGE